MTVRSACSARRRFSSSAFLLAAAAAAALALPDSTGPAAGALLPPLLAMDADCACALSLTDLPVLSRTTRAPTRLMYLKLIALQLLTATLCPGLD
jgi:hypothetical protein